MNDRPKKLKRVPLKEELVVLTGDFIKALILQQLLYWSERVSDFDDFIAEEKERSPELQLELRHGWIYKSTEQLHDELMFGDNLSPRTVKRRLDEIIHSGYLMSRNNPTHKWDRCLQYRPDIQKIQTDLQKMGYSLEGYPLLAPFDTVSNASVRVSNQLDSETNRSAISVQAIPETTPETTPESLKASSADADYSRPISLLSEKEIKALKLPPKDWKQYLADERAEKNRKGVIKFLETKIATGQLLPDTEAARLLFEKLAVEAEAKGRRPAGKFPTLACKEKFNSAAARLNGTLETAIDNGLAAGITAIPKLVNYISSPKWSENGQARTGKSEQKTYRPAGKSTADPYAPAAGSGQTPEMAAKLRAHFARQ